MTQMAQISAFVAIANGLAVALSLAVRPFSSEGICRDQAVSPQKIL
jgi:hypothetical protein